MSDVDAAAPARLGAQALAAGDARTACAHLARALELAPADVASWTNLGTALARLGRVDDALAAYRRAIAIDAHAIGARINLGNALHRSGDLDGAVAELEEARRRAPDDPDVHNNLGNLYKEQGRFDDALAAYRAARLAHPGFRPAFSNLLALTKLSTAHSPAEVYALHRAFAQRFEPEWQAGYVPPANDATPGRRLVIGYVSPDCHTALPAFVEHVLRSHDRERFDVFVYFNNPQPDTAVARCGPVAARVMKGLSDAEVAQRVRDDAVDILVDIAGHTGHNRLGVFGRKPAPVQFTWLDYLATTGLDAIDYRLTDAVSDPPGESDRLHSETLVRLAPVQWCWQPPSAPAAPGPLPAQSAGHLTLGSFNNHAKLTDATLALWARVLAAVPDARLVVAGVPAGHAARRMASAFGAIGNGRVTTLPRLAPPAFRQAIAEVDVALDPLPFSGATTTLEVLWQGVPVVTRPLASSASRSTASLLTALGMTAWIAADDEAYFGIVAAAAARLDELAALRSGLPSRLAQSPLCDAAAFARQLERVFCDAWGHWCVRRAAVQAAPRPPLGSAMPVAPRERRLQLDARLADLDAALRAGRGAEVVAEACALVDDAPEWQDAHRAYLQVLLAWAKTQDDLVARTFPPPPTMSRPPKVSVLMCSIDEDRFRQASDSYRERFAGHALEIVGVHDARSLAEGYNRAAARATGDVLVFSHDDVVLSTADFAARLFAHLERYDGVGVAGASRIAGPRWGDAGQRFVHGHILHAPPRGKSGVLLMVSGFQSSVCADIVALDGVFMAVRRHVWEATRFDADTFDGFHLYDMDFCRRASAAGARLAVPADLTLFHASQGRYGATWRAYARRFVATAGLDPLAPPRLGGLQVRLTSPEQVDALRAAMVHFRFGAARSSV